MQTREEFIEERAKSLVSEKNINEAKSLTQYNVLNDLMTAKNPEYYKETLFLANVPSFRDAVSREKKTSIEGSRTIPQFYKELKTQERFLYYSGTYKTTHSNILSLVPGNTMSPVYYFTKKAANIVQSVAKNNNLKIMQDRFAYSNDTYNNYVRSTTSFVFVFFDKYKMKRGFPLYNIYLMFDNTSSTVAIMLDTYLNDENVAEKIPVEQLYYSLKKVVDDIVNEFNKAYSSSAIGGKTRKQKSRSRKMKKTRKH